MSKETGFTLIELMVTVAILAIVVTIATPSGKDFLANRRTSAQAREILNTLQLARMTAINEGSTVELTFITKDGTKIDSGSEDTSTLPNRANFRTLKLGWDRDKDGTLKETERHDAVVVSGRTYIKCTTDQDVISFNSRGMANSASVRTLRKEGGNVLRTYNVVVSSLGLVRVVK